MVDDRAIQTTDEWHGAVRCTTATHPGTRRGVNEDAVLCRPDLGLWAVADGAGGHSNGAAAARAVVAALDTVPPGLNAAEMLARVRVLLAGVHRVLRGAGAAIMASTVVALIIRDDHFAYLWAGDSAAYRVRHGEVEKLTVDHSLVQSLVTAGTISMEAARHHPDANVITRAIGAGDQEPELDKRIGEVMSGDRFLLCSDGVCKTLCQSELAWRLCGGADAGGLVAAALDCGASDNITAVTVAVTGVT
jgi:serine/threonine-protein phosphatase Stp1